MYKLVQERTRFKVQFGLFDGFEVRFFGGFEFDLVCSGRPEGGQKEVRNRFKVWSGSPKVRV